MKDYAVNIGNVDPKEKVKLHAFFIQKLGSNDMSYEYEIMEKYPTFHYKELNQEGARDKIIKANFKITTQSKITRLIAPFYDEEAKKKSKYEVNLSNDYKIADINYIKNPYDKKNYDIEDNGANHGYPGKVDTPTHLTSFSILFRVEKMNNKPYLYYQYNKELKETSYLVNYIYSSHKLKDIPIPEIPDQDNKISYYDKYFKNLINDAPGLFVFLIDQSGSMHGQSISLVKEALLLFIRSLPKGSYFQFIGFGSRFKKYNDEPVEYNEKNVNRIISIIKELDANMGGTNIADPLREIYTNKVYDKINLSKNIFLLTDGQVFDRDECVRLITANSDKFKIHAIGMGYHFDKILIERSGKLSKGSSTFVQNIEEITSAVINSLNNGLRDYLTDLKFKFIQYEDKINNAIIKLNPKNDFSYQDEIITYSFILDDKYKIDIDNLNADIKLQITGKYSNDLINEIVELRKNSDNIIKIPDGDELSKIIVGQGLKNNKEFIEDKEKEISFAKKYQVLSKNTALYAEIKKFNDFQQKQLVTVDLNDYIYYPHVSSSLNRIKISQSIGEIPRFSQYSMHYSVDGVVSGSSSTPEIKRCINCKTFVSSSREEEMIMTTEMSSESRESIPETPNIIENKDELKKLIMTQNILEGFWDENEETKKLLQILSNDKIKEIENKIKNLNMKEESKIKYTIIVIYYLSFIRMLI